MDHTRPLHPPLFPAPSPATSSWRPNLASLMAASCDSWRLKRCIWVDLRARVAVWWLKGYGTVKCPTASASSLHFAIGLPQAPSSTPDPSRSANSARRCTPQGRHGKLSQTTNEGNGQGMGRPKCRGSAGGSGNHLCIFGGFVLPIPRLSQQLRAQYGMVYDLGSRWIPPAERSMQPGLVSGVDYSS